MGARLRRLAWRWAPEPLRAGSSRGGRGTAAAAQGAPVGTGGAVRAAAGGQGLGQGPVGRSGPGRGVERAGEFGQEAVQDGVALRTPRVFAPTCSASVTGVQPLASAASTIGARRRTCVGDSGQADPSAATNLRTGSGISCLDSPPPEARSVVGAPVARAREGGGGSLVDWVTAVSPLPCHLCHPLRSRVTDSRNHSLSCSSQAPPRSRPPPSRLQSAPH